MGAEGNGRLAGSPFRDWLVRAMAERRWTITMLADELARVQGSGTRDALRTRVSSWRRGIYEPSPKWAPYLAEVFGVEPDYVLGLMGVRPYGGEEEDDLDPRKAEVLALVRAADLAPAEWEMFAEMLHFWGRKHAAAPAEGSSAEG